MTTPTDNTVLLWQEKYRPTTLKNYIGNKKNIDKIIRWIERFREKDEGVERFLLLYGFPGIGKTTLAHIILNEYSYNVIEINSSENCGKGEKEKSYINRELTSLISSVEKIGKTNIESYFNGGNKKKNALILDEIDGIDNKSTVESIVKIIVGDDKKNNKYATKLLRYPVICTCNDIAKEKISSLIKLSLVIKLEPPTVENLQELGQYICKQEGIKIKKKELENMAYHCKLDYRQYIYMLYFKGMLGNCNMLLVDSQPLLSSPREWIEHFLKTKKIKHSEIQLKSSEHYNIYYLSIYANYIDIIFQNGDGMNTKDKKYKNKMRGIMEYVISNVLESNKYDEFICKKANWELTPYLISDGVVANILKIKEAIDYSKTQEFIIGRESKYNSNRQHEYYNNITISNLSYMMNSNLNTTDTMYINKIMNLKKNKSKYDVDIITNSNKILTKI